ncbi:MAG: T9SS type A sorting domain-containing protein, partial [Bacteroidetes bacterium]|nr:T9SS type A sorting domain-containing protein [Bacteroidota bacterium]
SQTFTRSTYILQLKWNSSVAPPLVDGYTYHVEINVKVNGVYSGFCASSCTITINNNPAPGGRVVPVEAVDQPPMNLWPNPNDGQRLNLAVAGLPLHMDGADVRVTDLTGRQVMMATLPVVEGSISTALDLNNAPNGTYLLLLTAGEKTYTQRIVVSR